MEHLALTDPEVADAVRHETTRQGSQLEMIASENFVSEAVLEAMGTPFTNKYAEGYPGRRYYGGCEYADVVESLAIARAKQLFGADHANVQPHSGAQANTAVYMSVLKPGDTMLGMNLSHGGHLTHGHPLNFSGRFYKVVAYGVRKEDERIDYDEIASLARQHKPKVIVLGASAYPRTIDFAAVRQAADEVGAIVFADIAHIAGLVVTGLHPSPVPHCEFVTTTTHKTLRGPRGGLSHVPGEVGEGARQGRLPGNAGRPSRPRDRGQGRGLQGGPGPGVQGLPAADPGQRPGPGQDPSGGRLPARLGGHRQPPHADRRLLARDHGQGRRSRTRQGRHHGQQEHHPLRHQLAHGRLRHPRGHTCPHHPRA